LQTRIQRKQLNVISGYKKITRYCYYSAKLVNCVIIEDFCCVFQNDSTFKIEYRRLSLYSIDRDLKNWLAYNKFAYNETNSNGKLEDTFLWLYITTYICIHEILVRTEEAFHLFTIKIKYNSILTSSNVREWVLHTINWYYSSGYFFVVLYFISLDHHKHLNRSFVKNYNTTLLWPLKTQWPYLRYPIYTQ